MKNICLLFQNTFKCTTHLLNIMCSECRSTRIIYDSIWYYTVTVLFFVDTSVGLFLKVLGLTSFTLIDFFLLISSSLETVSAISPHKVIFTGDRLFDTLIRTTHIKVLILRCATFLSFKGPI